MIMFVITFAGIVLSVLLRDSIPDSTYLWLILFLSGVFIMAVSEIRLYLHMHTQIKETRIQEREAMVNLMQERLLSEKKPAAADENKLAEQMVNEIKLRIAKKKGTPEQ